MRFTPSQTGSRLLWSGLTRISAALGPSVPSCLRPWTLRHFGLLQSRSPTWKCQLLSSLYTATRDCSWTLNLVTATTRSTRSSSLFSPTCRLIVRKASFDDVLQHLAVPSYAQDGIVFGPFYEGNEGTAIYNSSFRPFQSPVPFLFVRHTVISDWKFFLDKEDWLNLWARRFGESAVHALAEELRRLPWRVGRD